MCKAENSLDATRVPPAKLEEPGRCYWEVEGYMKVYNGNGLKEAKGLGLDMLNEDSY